MLSVMLDVRERSCLVVGGGSVALRKARSLLEEGARVTIVAPQVDPELAALSREAPLQVERRPYRRGEAARHALVFAATDDPEINRQVHDDATAGSIFVNVADSPALCSFHVPARLRRGGLEIAIASQGGAPFAVRRLRRLLEGRFGEDWASWSAAAVRFRERVRSRLPDPAAREACYDRFFSETVDAESLVARPPTETEMEEWAAAPATEGRRGSVSLVGAGPGCPGLLTLRGRQRLFEADAVAYDRLAAPALPPDLPADVELHCVGKEPGNHPIPQEEINALLIRLAQAGKRVVRLKGGDPYVFGRGSEEAEALNAAGVPFEVVPGVTAGVAVPAWVGVPLTHRREAVRVAFVTAHESTKDEAPHMRWDLLAKDPHATLVGYMGVTALPGVVARLIEGGMHPDTPAAIVERGTTAAQRVVASRLAALPAEAASAEIKPPALFVIGPTVRHAATLDWARTWALTGERLAVFPSHSWDPSPALQRAGAEVVRVRRPEPPVTRVLLAALPLTGCVLADPGDAERAAAWEGLTWSSSSVFWCLGADAAAAARRCGAARVAELDSAAPSELVRCIAGQRGRA